MFKKIALVTSLVLSGYASELTCKVELSSQGRSFEHELHLTLEHKEKAMVSQINQYQFSVKNVDDSIYELELFDSSLPSRYYSKGKLENSGDAIEWSLWSRDSLIDFKCRLGQ